MAVLNSSYWYDRSFEEATPQLKAGHAYSGGKTRPLIGRLGISLVRTSAPTQGNHLPPSPELQIHEFPEPPSKSKVIVAVSKLNVFEFQYIHNFPNELAQ